MELVVVIAIIAVLIILAALTLNPRTQLAKARDAKRRSDLKKISTILEDYNNDKGCYPLVLEDELPPYSSSIPRDPKTELPYYYYIPEGSDCGAGSGSSKYGLFANMELDTGIDYGRGNYVVTSPNYRVEGILPPAPTAIPTPTGSVKYYGCIEGICTLLSGDCEKTICCSPNYPNKPNCDPAGVNLCGTPSNPLSECVK